MYGNINRHCRKTGQKFEFSCLSGPGGRINDFELEGEESCEDLQEEFGPCRGRLNRSLMNGPVNETGGREGDGV